MFYYKRTIVKFKLIHFPNWQDKNSVSAIKLNSNEHQARKVNPYQTGS